MSASTYFDTALLVKTLVLEADSPDALALVEEAGDPILFTHLHEVEVPNAIRLKRHLGEITPAQEVLAIRALRADVRAGRFIRPDYDLAEVFYRAERLSSKWSGHFGTRSLDLWHVAAAIEIGCGVFASLDGRQRQCAEKCGLRVVPEH